MLKTRTGQRLYIELCARGVLRQRRHYLKLVVIQNGQTSLARHLFIWQCKTLVEVDQEQKKQRVRNVRSSKSFFHLA